MTEVWEPIEISSDQVSDLAENYVSKTDTYTYIEEDNSDPENIIPATQITIQDLTSRVNQLENLVTALLTAIPNTVISDADKATILENLDSNWPPVPEGEEEEEP